MGCCGSRGDVVLKIEGDQQKKEPSSGGDINPLPQAGGHEGSFILKGDKLLKRAGDAEIEFYTSLFSSQNTNQDLIELQQFVPNYYGLEKINDKNYLILENLLQGYEHPNILDCKIGKITWTKDHNERKTADQKQKAEKTTTGTLGFRITGLVTKDENGNTIESLSKDTSFYTTSTDNIHEQFRKIVGSDRKRLKKIIKQTKKILDWFRKQRSKHFFTASIFYINGKNDCQTKFIDFAHVYDAEGEPDNSNFYIDVIEGLTNLISVWERLLS